MGGFGAKSMKEVLDVKSRINRNTELIEIRIQKTV
jgi:hypothetical protein